MKTVIISDTHNLHDQVEIPEADLLVHCGDFTGRGLLQEIVKFNAWLGTLQIKNRIVCGGNHELLLESNPTLARSVLTNAYYLEEQMIEINGKTIYCSPWTPRFFDWAFNANRGPELVEKWSRIPEGLDLLVTHGPPYGILDKSNFKGGPAYAGDPYRDYPEHAGCADLLERVQKVRPRFHAFGHIHPGYGIYEGEHTTFINASIVNSHYQVTNQPIVINL